MEEVKWILSCGLNKCVEKICYTVNWSKEKLFYFSYEEIQLLELLHLKHQ